MKHKLTLISAVAFLAIALLLLPTCGRNRGYSDEADDTASRERISGVFASNPNQTLRISAHAMNELLLIQTASELGVNIEIYDYRFGEEESHYALMLSRMAAGAEPDIFIWGIVAPPIYRFVEERFLSDMYAVIESTDLFMNAVIPFEIEGQLLVIPTRFGFEYVGINENIPDSIMQRFASQYVVTPSFLMELYNDLIEQYPRWGEYAFMVGKNAYSFFRQELHRHVDFTTHNVALTRLTPMLDSLRTAFAGNYRSEYVHNPTDEHMQALQKRYVFHVTSTPQNALFDFVSSFFVHHIPLADESGRLIQRGWTGANVSISSSADSTLAWAFIQEFITQETSQHHRTTDIPILRQYSDSAVEMGYRHLFNLNQVRPIIENRETAVQSAMIGLLELSELPMTHPVDFLLPSLTSQIFDVFLQGNMTSGEAILQMEAEFLTWMGAEREVSEVEEEPEDNSHLPPRTLTFQGNNFHVAVAQQAADAMNLSWQRRGEQYRFELVAVDTFADSDFYGAEGRYMRLATQLMAGLGPDVFVLESSYDVHALARSGFLVDFYELMDNSSHTRREDLFAQPLTAFEMYGGLYMLPLSFCFHYVTINVNLPQSILDMYTQLETITLAQMMDIYMTLTKNYADTHGHMLFAQSNAFIRSFTATLQHAMYEFIDFEARRSDLVNPEFIAFLDDYRTLTEMQGEPISFVMNYVQTPRFAQLLYGWDDSLMFFLGSDLMNGGKAYKYFTHIDPIFSHTRLLTDSSGRLLLEVPCGTTATGPVWPAVSVTATGDYELAWEFIQYLTRAFTTPVGRSRGDWGLLFGYNNLGSPIRRDLLEYHTRRNIYAYFDIDVTNDRRRYLHYVGMSDPAERNHHVSIVMSRIATYNEMPMALLYPMLPLSLISNDRRLFMNGVLSSQEFAQQLQNTVSLWLIE